MDVISSDPHQDSLVQAGIFFFSYDQKTGNIQTNIDLENIFPNQKHPFDFSHILKFYRCLHPEDRVKLRYFFSESEDCEQKSVDIRLCSQNNHEYWLRIYKGTHTDNKISGMCQNISYDKQYQRGLAQAAYTDGLTGFINAHRMQQKLAVAIGAWHEYQVKSMFLMISIDNLGSLNQMFGHHVADDVIVAVAGLLASMKRKTDLIARLGAGKFAILLTNTQSDDIEAIGERFLSSIRGRYFETRSGSIYVTASGGGCLIPEDSPHLETIFSVTEESIYLAKSRGGNRFIRYIPDEKNNQKRLENTILSEKIVKSIADNRICAAFQPVIHPKNPEKSFFEMLARIKDKDGTLIPAFQFINIAENTGFVRNIDMYIFKHALELLALYPHLQLSVNLSGTTLSNSSLTRDIVALSQEYQAVSQRLIVEITETVALQDIYGIQYFMDTLKNLGFRIALDDFGAGYNSFSNLKSYPFDIVKIDGIYIRDLHKDVRNQIFVKTLAEMAASLKMEIVAEMISETEELNILRDYPIDYYQGFKFGKPEIDLQISFDNMYHSLDSFSHTDNEFLKHMGGKRLA